MPTPVPGDSSAASSALPLRPRAAPPGRRRALIALLLLAPFAVAACAEVGAAVAVSSSNAAARSLSGAGDYAPAAGAYLALAARRGPLFWLDRGPIAAASGNADATVLAWADALARAGHTESALGLLDEIQTGSPPATPPAAVDRERVQILLAGVRTADAAGDRLTAVARADELAPLDIPGDLRGEVDALIIKTEVAAAPNLIAAGRPVEAVAALDDVIHRVALTSDGIAARLMLPGTLLQAGRLTLSECDFPEALGLLTRLAGDYPATPEGQTAATMLRVGQDVTGTVVQHDGTASAGPVRLAEHFVASTRGDYATGPYYSGRADDSGDFIISGVPIGGPYTLELDRTGGWVTPIDRDTGQPAYQTSIAPLTPVDLTFVVLPA